jgi:hypothetical protein
MALRLRHTSDQHPDASWPQDGADYVVMSGEVAVGRIMRLQDGPQDGNWMWSVTGLVHSDGPLHGVATSPSDAQATFADAWRGWLARAGLTEVEPPTP